jgi:hypothetical protein
LGNWGIINYLAAGSVHHGLRMATSLLKEEPTGELQLPLKSIDGLILFDRPKCSLQMEDISSMVSSSTNSELVDLNAAFADLDGKIRERLSESSCSYCLQSLTSLHYQSQKEVRFFGIMITMFSLVCPMYKSLSVSLKLLLALSFRLMLACKYSKFVILYHNDLRLSCFTSLLAIAEVFLNLEII